MDFHGHIILVLGLGDSGLAMARWCAAAGATVRVADSRAQPPRAAELHEQVPQATLHTEGFPVSLLDGVNRVLKSPGLSPLDPALAPLLALARDTGIPVQGELDLWWQSLGELRRDHGYRPRVVAVTGTNGKTTVTTLASLLIQRSGRRVAMAGNVGPTLLEVLGQHLEPALAQVAIEPQPGQAATQDASDALVADAATVLPGEPEDVVVPAAVAEGEITTPGALDADEGDTTPDPLEDRPLPIRPPVLEPEISTLPRHMPEVWVLELSSFQLDGVAGFAPDAAVILNISQDHLDWHGDTEAYAAAKGRIYAGRGVLIGNRDDDAVMALVQANTPPVVRGKAPRTVTTFGLDAPERPGDYGLVQAGGMDWLARALETDETIKRRKGEADELHVQRLMPADALRIRGRHNAANALAALALATAIGCRLAPMLHGLRDYRGEPHRVDLIGTVNDVAFYDDSKGTNVGATVAALNGLGHDHGPGARLLVILGGDGKGQDFTPLCAPVARHARFVALIGRDASTIATALRTDPAAGAVQAEVFDTLPLAVWACAEHARGGDAVLMSPACASLDMFRNYSHRAEVFVAAVHEWAARQGVALS